MASTWISLCAEGVVGAGAAVLIAALVPVRRLMAKLPSGAVRNRWYAMTALIVLFVLAYLCYALAYWKSHSTAIDLFVPAVFLLGASFVWLTATLSLQTAIDVMRVKALERESVTDALTGLFNRRYLDCRLTEEIATARRYGFPLSVVLLDVDHFKAINDRHGHQIGDQVLATLGQLISGGLRESDMLSRYGGEEFLIITPHTSALGAAGVAERVRQRIEAHEFAVRLGRGTACRLRVTASIGVATLASGVDNKESLIQAADENLYRAKQQGRNRVVALLQVEHQYDDPEGASPSREANV